MPEVIRSVPTGLARASAVATAATVALQLWAVYRPTAPPGEGVFPGIDKVGHFTIFALPVLCGLVSLAAAGVRRRWWLPVVFALHAVVSEVVQHFWYAHRDGDPFDVLADVVGVAAGVLLARLVERRLTRRHRTHPVPSGRAGR